MSFTLFNVARYTFCVGLLTSSQTHQTGAYSYIKIGTL